MMACNTCGHVFDDNEAYRIREYTGVSSEGHSEVVECWCCPNCGDELIEEAHRCQFCGDWTLDWLCDDCKKLIKTTLEGLVCESARLHRKNGVKFNRAFAENAISEVLEEL